MWLNERFIIAPIYLNDTRFSKTQEYVSKCFSLSDGPEILKFITCDIDTYKDSRSGQADKMYSRASLVTSTEQRWSSINESSLWLRSIGGVRVYGLLFKAQLHVKIKWSLWTLFWNAKLIQLSRTCLTSYTYTYTHRLD